MDLHILAGRLVCRKFGKAPISTVVDCLCQSVYLPADQYEKWTFGSLARASGKLSRLSTELLLVWYLIRIGRECSRLNSHPAATRCSLHNFIVIYEKLDDLVNPRPKADCPRCGSSKQVGSNRCRFNVG